MIGSHPQRLPTRSPPPQVEQVEDEEQNEGEENGDRKDESLVQF